MPASFSRSVFSHTRNGPSDPPTELKGKERGGSHPAIPDMFRDGRPSVGAGDASTSGVSTSSLAALAVPSSTEDNAWVDALSSEIFEDAGEGEEKGKEEEGHVMSCWGEILCGHDVHCSPGFTPGKGHFKNKFCMNCRKDGIKLPAANVRVVLPGCTLRNERCAGFWNAPQSGVGPYRLVNQTAECSDPKLLVSAYPAFGEALGPVPESLIDHEGLVWLVVSKGTLCPVGRHRNKRQGEALDSPHHKLATLSSSESIDLFPGASAALAPDSSGGAFANTLQQNVVPALPIVPVHPLSSSIAAVEPQFPASVPTLMASSLFGRPSSVSSSIDASTASAHASAPQVSIATGAADLGLQVQFPPPQLPSFGFPDDCLQHPSTMPCGTSASVARALAQGFVLSNAPELHSGELPSEARGDAAPPNPFPMPSLPAARRQSHEPNRGCAPIGPETADAESDVPFANLMPAVRRVHDLYIAMLNREEVRQSQHYPQMLASLAQIEQILYDLQTWFSGMPISNGPTG